VDSAKWGTFDAATWPADHAEEIGCNLDNLVLPPAFPYLAKFDKIVANVPDMKPLLSQVLSYSPKVLDAEFPAESAYQSSLSSCVCPTVVFPCRARPADAIIPVLLAIALVVLLIPSRRLGPGGHGSNTLSFLGNHDHRATTGAAQPEVANPTMVLPAILVITIIELFYE